MCRFGRAENAEHTTLIMEMIVVEQFVFEAIHAGNL
jgi:hypothetical protein